MYATTKSYKASTCDNISSSSLHLKMPRSVPPGRVFAMAWSSESLPLSIMSFRIFKFSSTEFFFFTPSFGWADPSPEMTTLCSMVVSA